jgi:hypothetical protein
MAPHTRNQGNLPENDNGGNVGNPASNGNPETLTALAAQLVDLLKMGANANREVRQNEEEQRGCTFEQFNKQHPLVLKDFRMRWLQRTGYYRWRS